MSQTVKAIYENGVFKPLQKVNIKPHQKAELIIFPEGELSLCPEDVQKLVKSQKKALAKFIGKGKSADGDLSENHDKYLYQKTLTGKYASYYQTLSSEEEKEISSLGEDFAYADAETENILEGQAE